MVYAGVTYELIEIISEYTWAELKGHILSSRGSFSVDNSV